MTRHDMGKLVGSLAAGKGELLVKLEKKNEIIREQQRAIARLSREVVTLRTWVETQNPN